MVSVKILPEPPIVGAIALADRDAKSGELVAVHGRKHSSAFIADLFSPSVDASAPSMFFVPAINFSLGEVGLWNE